MGKSTSLLTFSVIFFLLLILTPSSSNLVDVVKAGPPPNDPYEGIGDLWDIHEYARNDSITFTNGLNDTTFTYYDSWYPVGYRGYGLYSKVSNLRRITDPVPNGDFEDVAQFDDTWNLTNSHPLDPLVVSISNVTGGNPNYCLDMELAYKRLNGQRIAFIDNDFNYTTTFVPDSLQVFFDVKFSGDVTQKDWLIIKVAIINQGQEKGSWANNLADNHEPTWQSYSFTTLPVIGLVRLRISLEKITSKNEQVDGHIWFDNFRYEIGSYAKPSEANLTLNDMPLLDTVGAEGEINIYADPGNKDEAPWPNCWGTSQTFDFNSSYEISFDYIYSMNIKSINTGAAPSSFKAPVDGTPTWKIEYNVPGDRPPSGHTGYSFGLYLRSDWTLITVNDSSGQPILYTYNATSRFVRINEGEAVSSETYSIYASSLNYVLEVHPQKAPSASGPWTNISSGDAFIKDDYIRIMAELRPIGTSINNYANVSIFYPNGTLWQSAESPTDVTFHDGNDTLTSKPWQIPQPGPGDIGLYWMTTVSFDNNTQCGMHQSSFIVAVPTVGTKKTPADGARIIWGQTVLVNVTWQNGDTLEYIPDAYARIRYVDRNLVVRYSEMYNNGQGGYHLDFSTNLMSPNLNAQFHVELFRRGYVNASYAEGTQLTFTVNLVNDINYVMINPTQQTGPNEFTGETSRSQGYTCQVKFYDPYQGAYVLNETSIWPAVLVTFLYYEDTGSGWGSPLLTDSFSHNTITRVFFKHNYTITASVQKVKYEITMRVEDASWEFEQQNFTIIFNIVSWATNLDAVRTNIDYPPLGMGDGWTEFDQVTDTYEVHIYWNEKLNITVYYENVSNLVGIQTATVKILIKTSLYSLNELSGGYYNYTIDTATLNLGLTNLYINATYPAHASQTIRIMVIVEPRETQLKADYPGITAELPFDSDFVVTFSFNDTVGVTTVPIIDATVSVTGFPAGNFTLVNNGDGTYVITFWGNITETTYHVSIYFDKTNYDSKSKYFEITIRLIHTTASGYAESPSVPWGDNVTITLSFDDIDNGFGIHGATLSFTWFDNILSVDYWLIDHLDGTYTITLNTTKAPVGTQGYIITFYMHHAHYDDAQINVIFQVRDIQTILYIIDLNPGTSIPWGDPLILTLNFNDSDHGDTSIHDAIISCDWEPVYWICEYSAIQDAYLLTIYTHNSLEGSYTLHVSASKSHYNIGINLQGFVIREIQTGFSVDQAYFPSHQWGDDLTIQVDYIDLDHGSIISNALVSIDWDAGNYTIFDHGNGTYSIELNTACRAIGTYQLIIELSKLHYTNRTIPITIGLEPILMKVEVLEPLSSQQTVNYNDLVVITIYVNDSKGNPINDADAYYDWAGRNSVLMTFIGDGIYTVSFRANETIGTYAITIRVNKTNYQPGVGSVILIILPIDTIFTVLTPFIDTIIEESFTISVNYTTINGVPINDATLLFRLANRSGSLILVAPGIYNATIDSQDLPIGSYTIYLTAYSPNVVQRTGTISVSLTVIPTDIFIIEEPHEIVAGVLFSIIVSFNDTFHGEGIADANLTILILGLQPEVFTIIDKGDGTYTITGIIQSPGLHTGTIYASGSSRYAEASTDVSLLVEPNPIVQNILTIGAVTAIIGMFLFGTWLAYSHVFSIPWLVRKMRKMSKKIGKGQTPTLSKGEIGRITPRLDQIAHLIEPSYETIKIAVPLAAIPPIQEIDERLAEDETIWNEIQSLPRLETKQKIELFEEMKRIPSAERVWFIEDLKRQMADGTRFARLPKEPLTPEVLPEVELELKQRLATFPDLSKAEKDRLFRQLREMPKEEWEDIFATLALVPLEESKVEKLLYDEFPRLSEEEKQRLLKDLEGLSEEERRKVLQTLREKHAEQTSEAKIVKGKRSFAIEEDEEKGGQK